MGAFFSSILEEGVDVPKLPVVKLLEEQTSAIAANQASLPASKKTAEEVNQFNLQQWLKGKLFAFPEFEKSRDLIAGNAMDWLEGKVSLTDRNTDWMKTSAIAFSGGYSGSQMHDFANVRNYGLRVQDTKMKGQNAIQSWLSSLDLPQQYDITSMFISPTDLYKTKNEQNLQQFQREYASNVTDAHYSWSSRIGRGLDEALDIVLSMYSGGMMGSGTKGGTSSSGGGNMPSGYQNNFNG